MYAPVTRINVITAYAMSNTASTQTGMMYLPGEIRDEIYTHLLTSTYRVDTSPSFRLSNLSNDTQVGSFTGPGFGQEVTLSPLFTFERPSNRVAILRVNRTIGAEAKEVLYKFSTFVFNVAPSLGFGNIKAVWYMQNVIVNFDLSPQCRHDQRLGHSQATLAAAQRLLSYFDCLTRVRGTCIIKVEYCSDLGFLDGPLSDSLCQLDSFKTVYLEFWEVAQRIPETEGVFAPLRESWRARRLQVYAKLDHMLSATLGSGELGLEGDSVFYMKYHPGQLRN